MSKQAPQQYHFATERDPACGQAREMADADFEAVQSFLGAKAQESLLSHGALTPTLFFVTIGEKPGEIKRLGLMTIEEVMTESRAPEIIDDLMQKMLADANHDFVVFAHEAVVIQSDAELSAGEDVHAAAIAAAQNPMLQADRAEALVLRSLSKNRQALSIRTFTRGADGDIDSFKGGELIFPSVESASAEHTPEQAALASRPPNATLH